MRDGGSLILLLCCIGITASTAAAAPDPADAMDVEPCRGRADVVRLTDDPRFQRAVARFKTDRDFPDTYEEPGWRPQMAEFVPDILAGLESGDPCLRAAAIELVRHGPRDDRLLAHAIVEVRKATSPEDAGIWLRALDWQNKWWEPSAEARTVALEYIAKPEYFRDAYPLALHVCGPGDAGPLAEVFLARGALRADYGPAFLKHLLELGGSDLPDIMLTALAGATEGRAALADAVLRAFFPERRTEGRHGPYRLDIWGGPPGMLAFLTSRAGAALPDASDRMISEVLMQTPENMEGGPATRARYWSAAASVFAERPEVRRLCLERLADAYGTDGLGDLDRALEYLDAARGVSASGWVLDRLSELQCRRAAKVASRGVTLSSAAPLPEGRSWEGVLSVPGDLLSSTLQSEPICFIDVAAADGSVRAFPAAWILLGSEASLVRFQCDLLAAAPAGRARVRLLVVASQGPNIILESDWRETP